MGRNKSKGQKKTKMSEYEKQLKRHHDFVNRLRAAGIDEGMRNYERLPMFEPIGHFNKTERYEINPDELPGIEGLIETPEQMNERIMKQSVKKIELIEDDKKTIVTL